MIIIVDLKRIPFITINYTASTHYSSYYISLAKNSIQLILFKFDVIISPELVI